jgi:trans-aconitate 2-methyltransferase
MLLSRLPGGRAIGLDRSMNMLNVAREHLAGPFRGRVSFVLAELPQVPIRAWADITFSTATFHWVLDHEKLFRGIFGALRPGGRLIAQCGGVGNLDRIHAQVLAVCRSSGYARWFANWRTPWEYAGPETTRARLRAAGFEEIEAAIEEAPTRFATAEEFALFMTTVVLRPFLARLPGERERSAFVDEVVGRARGDDPPFLLDYRRLNMRARRPESGDKREMANPR